MNRKNRSCRKCGLPMARTGEYWSEGIILYRNKQKISMDHETFENSLLRSKNEAKLTP